MNYFDPSFAGQKKFKGKLGKCRHLKTFAKMKGAVSVCLKYLLKRSPAFILTSSKIFD